MSATSSSVMPWTAVAAGGIGTPGLTRRVRWIDSPDGKSFSTLTSMMCSVFGSVPVVSRSITASGRSKTMFLSMVPPGDKVSLLRDFGNSWTSISAFFARSGFSTHLPAASCSRSSCSSTSILDRLATTLAFLVLNPTDEKDWGMQARGLHGTFWEVSTLRFPSGSARYGMSSTNVDLVRRWFEEVWNQRRTDTIDELFSPTKA